MSFEIIVNGRTGERETIPLSAEVQQFKNEEAAAAPARWLELLRTERDKRLAETDHLGLPDFGGFSAEMTAYRQALRDLPANTADPANPVWPVKPGSEVVAEEPGAKEPAAEEPATQEPVAEEPAAE